MFIERSTEKQIIIQPKVYDALWSAYYIVIIFDNGKQSEGIKMNCGTRGMNIKCKVEVKNDGYVYII